MRLRKKLISEEQGQALVEFSFICVVLLMLAGGVADGVSVIRYSIALQGAATEVVNQISSSVEVESQVADICERVIKENFQNSLGDGNTTFSCSADTDTKIDEISYAYHDEDRTWRGNRKYVPVAVTLERNQVLLTPFGQLIFGDPGNGGRRLMKVTAQTRAYMN